MVERSLSMREAPGSIPGLSIFACSGLSFYSTRGTVRLSVWQG